MHLSLRIFILQLSFCILHFAFCTSSASAADWPTNRGNSARTGNLDDKPGPKEPIVLWSHKSPEHYIAAPVLGDKGVYVSGLGAFNTGVFYYLGNDPKLTDRILWMKSAPFIKRPLVCPPAISDGLMILGDGMHQTDGAILYCLSAATGRALWQLDVPGKLVHLEGAPAIADGRVYTGGGAAGVLCVGLKTAVLDGKEQPVAALEKMLDERWAALVAKYEVDKRRDDLAMPPNDDQLPRPLAKLIWKKGEGKWHVDAPMAVHGDRVYAASALIDEEKIGVRSLFCLNAADGATVWEAPLRVNPWAGATVVADKGIILVGCSTIRFDRKLLKGARGEIVAIDMANGQFKWRIDVPGGVLSSVAVKGDIAVFTATDGKVRAINIADGQPKWTYEAANPFFAAPAISGGSVYAADLRGVLHAMNLSDGKPQWAIDVTADPMLMAPGSVYGAPIVSDGRVYLATCNIDAEQADAQCIVACVADKSLAASMAGGPTIAVDKAARSIRVPGKIAPRKLITLKEIYPLEVVAAYPSPRGQKAHETVITFDAKPSDIHKALEGLGLKPGTPAREDAPPTGPTVRLLLEFTGADGEPRTVPIDRTIVDRRTGRPLPTLKWYFTGSVMRQPDPNRDLKVYGADLTGTLVAIFPVTDETLFQSNLTMKDSTLLRLETNRNVLPVEGTPVTLIIQADDQGPKQK
ncbi:MAG: PQQ-binding-like beta-propeller repeat protein [Phycisphaerae bacterium]|nr:PQQ-binding-like beta-propeller repeat protein [Phycisphaerae bacterium]